MKEKSGHREGGRYFKHSEFYELGTLKKEKKIRYGSLWLYSIIKTFCYGEKRECFPGYKLLKELMGLSDSNQLKVYRDELNQHKLLKWRFLKGDQRTVYQYYLPEEEKLFDTDEWEKEKQKTKEEKNHYMADSHIGDTALYGSAPIEGYMAGSHREYINIRKKEEEEEERRKKEEERKESSSEKQNSDLPEEKEELKKFLDEINSLPEVRDSFGFIECTEFILDILAKLKENGLLDLGYIKTVAEEEKGNPSGFFITALKDMKYVDLWKIKLASAKPTRKAIRVDEDLDFSCERKEGDPWLINPNRIGANTIYKISGMFYCGICREELPEEESRCSYCGEEFRKVEEVDVAVRISKDFAKQLGVIVESVNPKRKRRILKTEENRAGEEVSRREEGQNGTSEKIVREIE